MSEPAICPDTLAGQLEALHRESFAWALACCAHHAHDAEEVLQMSYLKALEGRARFEGRSAFKTWLFGVIRMTAREQRRRVWWRWVRQVRAGEGRECATDDDSPDDAMARGEEIARVRAACDRLSSRQRQVLMLVFHHELSLDEAAAVMGVSPGSARQHYHRGKEQLRGLLGGSFSNP